MRVAVFIPSYGDGGVERALVKIASALSEQQVDVDFVTAHRDQPYLDGLASAVSLITLGGNARAGESYRAFLDYLGGSRPDVLMSAKDQAHVTALAARAETGLPVRLIMRAGTTVSAKYRPLRFWRTVSAYRRMRKYYPRADRLIAVSDGVARDVSAIIGLPEGAIETVRNPVVTPRLYELADEPAAHPWLEDRTCPVLVAMGGLRRQKGFADLLSAVAIAGKFRDMRLIIIGQGRLRDALQRLAQRLGIEEAVDFAGFVENPYPLLASADLFVLSSLWEGLANVVVEALALGRRVVATDCPNGSREALGGGRYGTLVPVKAPKQMASALQNALAQPPPDPEHVREAISAYTLEASANRYKEVVENLVVQDKKGA